MVLTQMKNAGFLQKAACDSLSQLPLETHFTLYSALGDYIELILFCFSLFMIFIAIIKKSPT
jgi:apolipoprotein N-acyltransferase